MSTYLYRLNFVGPLHLGLHGIGLEAVEERLGSDSLTSALINGFAVLEGSRGANELVEALLKSPPAFVLSSLFPFGPAPENKSVPLEAVPRPLINPLLAKKDAVKEYGKDLKRLKYLRVDDLRSWISEVEEVDIEKLIQRSKTLTQEWWREELRPRVAIDRTTSNSSVWNQAAIRFLREEKDSDGKVVAKAGLYGLIRFNDERWEGRVASAFRLLGEMGLGGERTYGLGLFQFDGFEPLLGAWRSFNSCPSKFHVLFSTYYPSEIERESLRESLEAWEAKERRGYIVSGRNTTTIKRKRVRMILEGSVTRKVLQGKMVDVTPDHASELGISHRVYRSGLAFLVPGGGL